MRLAFGVILLLFAGGESAFAQSAAGSPANCNEEKEKNGRYEKQLSDWPQTARYRDANAKVPPPSQNESRIVFMGDSITEGWDLARYFPERPFINRGISGQTTPQMLIRFRADVVELKPKAVVILAGTNDIAGNTGNMPIEDTMRNLQSMAEIARSNNIRVVLASVLPVNDRVRDRDGRPIVQTPRRPNETIAALNARIKKYAAANDLIFLDYYSSTADANGTLMDGISYDGLHPNDKGYAVMSRLADEAIKSAVGK